MTELRVDHPGGSLRITVGTRVTFGRSAQVTLTLARGEADRQLHNEAFGITAEETGFTIDVQNGHREVKVTRLPVRSSGRLERRRVIGDRMRFSWDSAEIEVAATIEHRVKVVAIPSRPDPVAVQVDTDEAFHINLANRGDRLLVAMCRDRLEQLAAPALTYEEAIAILSGAGRAEDRHIVLSTARSEVRRAIVEIEGWRGEPISLDDPAGASPHRRDRVVEWLVSRHVVTAELYDLVATAVVR